MASLKYIVICTLIMMMIAHTYAKVDIAPKRVVQREIDEMKQGMGEIEPKERHHEPDHQDSEDSQQLPPSKENHLYSAYAPVSRRSTRTIWERSGPPEDAENYGL